jgi:hypothetical protein
MRTISMKNKAKCRLCNTIVESFHSDDYVQCSCGHIAVDGGNALKCYAVDFKNFIRIDDEGKEVDTRMEDNKKEDVSYESKPNKKELLEMLQAMIKNIEKLPPNAMNQPITHYDQWSLMVLLESFLRLDCLEDI